jgi:hypothetical protein
LERIARDRVDNARFGVNDQDGSGRSGWENGVIDRNLAGCTITQVQTEAGLARGARAVNKDQVTVSLAVEDKVTG